MCLMMTIRTIYIYTDYTVSFNQVYTYNIICLMLLHQANNSDTFLTVVCISSAWEKTMCEIIMWWTIIFLFVMRFSTVCHKMVKYDDHTFIPLTNQLRREQCFLSCLVFFFFWSRKTLNVSLPSSVLKLQLVTQISIFYNLRSTFYNSIFYK